MDLTKFDQLENYINSKDAGISKYGMRNDNALLSQGGGFMKPIKMERNSNIAMILPIELRLPFNPADGSTEVFNSENEFIMPGTVDLAIAYMKQLAQTVPTLHAKLASYLRVTPEEYDVSNPEEITEQDKNIFWRFRKLQVLSALTQEFRMSGIGKYGRTGLSLVKFDENGMPTEKDLGYMLYELDTAIINNQIRVLKEQYAEGGEKSHLTSKDFDKDREAILDTALVKKPKIRGVVRVIALKCTPTWNLKLEDEKTAEDVVADISSFEGYIRVSSEMLSEKVLPSLNNPVYDTHPNYLQLDVNTPSGSGSTTQEKNMSAGKNRTFSGLNAKNIEALVPGFDEAYSAFRNDATKFNEEIVIKSVYEFKPVPDSDLLSHYKTDLGEKVHLINEGTADKFMELLQRIDSTLSEQLMQNIMLGEIAEGEADTVSQEKETEFIDHEATGGEEAPVDTTPVADLLAGTDLK